MAEALSAMQSALEHLNQAQDLLKTKIAESEPVEQSNGHFQILLEENAAIDIAPNGTILLRFDNGVSVEHGPNGRKSVAFEDGTRLDTLQDGTRILHNPTLNTQLTELPDGTQTIQELSPSDMSASAEAEKTTTLEHAASVDSLAFLDELEDTTDDDEDEDSPRLETSLVVDGDKPKRSVLRHGWLLKEGGSIKTWRKRFFVLTSDCLLSYYDKPPEVNGRFINAIDVVAAQAIIAGDIKKPHGFYLFSEPGTPRKGSATNKRSKYVLCCTNDMDREEWITSINACHDDDLASLDGSIRPIPNQSLASRVASFAKNINATNKMRQMVSKQKVRFQLDGYDLDLTYITENLIAMGYPSEGSEAVYRNKYEDVYRLLEEKHHGRYRVYNLCSERAYPGKKFCNRVACFPFDDHNPAPLELIQDCCADIHRWLARHPDNCAAVHCKAGKGRTGLIISCYLMYSGLCPDADSAMKMFGAIRTHNGKGVTIPSQRRYIRYYQHILKAGGEIPPPRPIYLESMTIRTIPNVDLAGGCQPFLRIYQDNISRYSSKLPDGNVPHYRRSHHTSIMLPCNLQLAGDIRFEVWNTDRVFHQDEKMFAFTIYSGCLAEGGLRLSRMEVDGAHKKKDLKVYDEAFAVELSYSFVAEEEVSTV
eukprot:TRINITY_DN10130_c0_g1_i3.p1 TRINITY_DN10130_c0_g1~~TRINITY_DN10130_c0_g1_i3.p1  ORF type:complete len:649 (+),score=150.79 TRINITY_DN10130_c0_g1_i3:175-2121(+)